MPGPPLKMADRLFKFVGPESPGQAKNRWNLNPKRGERIFSFSRSATKPRLMLRTLVFLFVSVCVGFGQQTSVQSDILGEVAATVRQLRETYRLPKLKQIEDKSLSAEACRVAAEDAEWAIVGGSTPGSKWGEDHAIVFVYPPSPEAQKQLERVTTDDRYNRIKRFSVGICHATSDHHLQGADWIGVAFYLGAFEAALEKPRSF
jgi:hypothetical protein